MVVSTTYQVHSEKVNLEKEGGWVGVRIQRSMGALRRVSSCPRGENSELSLRNLIYMNPTGSFRLEAVE